MSVRLFPPIATALAVAVLGVPGLASAAPLHFAPAVYVDQQLAGGEPLVTADPVHGTLIYTSHEGTTHLYQPGLASSSTLPFLGNYRDQVNIWTSKDDGKTWQLVNFQSTGFATDPSHNVGFSDPDLTTDAGGRVYDTGIDLANDALFSTADGGKTWDRGTPQCHNGDRPWLAGGKKDEVFLATNTTEDDHEIFQSTDGGNTCSSTGVSDTGKLADGTSYSGDGKLLYVPDRDMLVEATCLGGGFCDKGLGVSTWKRGDKQFTPRGIADHQRLLAHWPAMAIDTADTLYLVWDTDPRKADNGGCSNTMPLTGNGPPGSPLPNQVQYAYSHDMGQTWSAPITVAAPPNARAFWPWLVAGEAGTINIVWYQSDKLADLDCESSKISIESATIQNADTTSPAVQTVDAVGQPIHNSGVCQGGTTCAATGQDRRLGDFFTNSIDSRGCVTIASGDTRKPDPATGGPRVLSLPIFIRQDSGPALVGGGDCSGETAALGLPAGNSVAGGNTNTSTNRSARCASRRSFRIRLRAPNGERLRSATIFVGGKRVSITSRGKRYSTIRGRLLRAPVNLRGLPKGTVTVRVQAVTTSGKHYVQVRRYRTCTLKRTSKPKKHPLHPKRKG
jgi:hypothetical protein